jgi:hypothetical protein
MCLTIFVWFEFFKVNFVVHKKNDFIDSKALALMVLIPNLGMGGIPRFFYMDTADSGTRAKRTDEVNTPKN